MPVVTIEQRLDRLERVAKLFVRAGLRARRNMRELDEKINMLVDAQIKAEDRWAIAAYIRVLQLSAHATLDDVPPIERGKLK